MNKMNESVINSIKEIDNTISKMETQKNDLIKSISELQQAKELLYKANNICKECNGKGYSYNYDLIKGDPYAKSYEARDTCKTCNGNGKYSE